jgi:hypothetical protein
VVYTKATLGGTHHPATTGPHDPAIDSSGARGFDGGKMVNGRKRHIVVDTLGLVLTIGAHAAFV